MRTVIASCLFNDPGIMRESLTHMKTTLGKDREVFLLDQHWPIKKNKSHEECKSIAQDLGATLFDAGYNLGLHNGYNYIFEKAGLTDEDLVLCVDPDTWLVTEGWDTAMEEVLLWTDCVWTCLMNEGVETEQNVGWREQRILVPNGSNAPKNIKAWRPARPCIQSICGFKYSWLRKIGGFNEPSAFYGGLECALYSKLDHTNEVLLYLPDYRDDFFHFSPRGIAQYNEYKIAHAHKGSWKGDFESYLKEKYPRLIEEDS